MLLRRLGMHLPTPNGLLGVAMMQRPDHLLQYLNKVESDCNNQNYRQTRSVVLTDIFPVAAVVATVGLRWPLCINNTKKAVKFNYTFKLYQ
jgi:hypothetical protein